MAANDVRPSPDHPADMPAGGELPTAAPPGALSTAASHETGDATADVAAAELAAADRPSEAFGEPLVDASPHASGDQAGFSSTARLAPSGSYPSSAAEAAATDPATGAADTAAAGTGAGTTVSAPARRSFASTLLSVIGLVLMLLLAANLYTLYNPPGNDALQAAIGEVGTLRSRVAALEGRPQQTVDLSPIDGRLKDLATQMAAVQSETASLAGKADAAAALQGKVTALQDTTASLQSAVAALPKVDLAPLTARLDALDTRMQPLEAYFNAPKIAEQVTEARQNGSAAETRAAPQAVLAQGILADVEAGGRSFAAPVQALGRLGVDEAALAPLRAVADTGTATQAELLAGFSKIENDLVASSAPVDTGTGGVLGRMLANAQSLVSVTRTGATPGEDPGAVASRIEADLRQGDLRSALTQWNSLPDSGKAKSSAWADRLKARLAAADAAHSIAAKAVEALAVTTP